MSVVGMLSGDVGQAADGVGIDADEASGGADAATLVEVLEHGEGFSSGRWLWNRAVPLRSEKRYLQALQ